MVAGRHDSAALSVASGGLRHGQGSPHLRRERDPQDPQTSKGGNDMAENTTGLEPAENPSTESDTGPDVEQEGDFQGEY